VFKPKLCPLPVQAAYVVVDELGDSEIIQELLKGVSGFRSPIDTHSE
jgi:hypothetical protein